MTYAEIKEMGWTVCNKADLRSYRVAAAPFSTVKTYNVLSAVAALGARRSEIEVFENGVWRKV